MQKIRHFHPQLFVLSPIKWRHPSLFGKDRENWEGKKLSSHWLVPQVKPPNITKQCEIHLTRLVDLLKVVIVIFHPALVFIDSTSFDCLPFAKILGWPNSISDCTKSYWWKCLIFCMRSSIELYFLHEKSWVPKLTPSYPFYELFSLPSYLSWEQNRLCLFNCVQPHWPPKMKTLKSLTVIENIPWIEKLHISSAFRITNKLSILQNRKKLRRNLETFLK